MLERRKPVHLFLIALFGGVVSCLVLNESALAQQGEWRNIQGESSIPSTTTLVKCLNSPAALRICIEAGILNLGQVAVNYVGRGKDKDLIKLLQRWGGKVVNKGGKGSHTKVNMPSGRVEIVPHSPSIGVARQILKAAIEEAK